MKIEYLSIAHFPIVQVLLGEGNAILTRQGEIEVSGGTSHYIISKLTSKLNKDSLHVTILESESDISLQTPNIKDIKPQVQESDLIKSLRDQITNIDEKLSKLNFRSSSIEQKSDTSKKFLMQTGTEFLAQFSEKEMKLNQFVNLVTFINKSCTDLRLEQVSLTDERANLEEEKRTLTTQLKELLKEKQEAYNELFFTLIAPEKMTRTIKIQIRYRVPANWAPSYDLKISNGDVQLFFWSIIQNYSGENWDNVKLELMYAGFDEVSVAHPVPQPLEKGIEGKLDTYFQQFRQETPQIKGQTTESLSPLDETISVPADEDTHAYLMYSFTTSAELFYYWNAAETDYIVFGVEFTNGEVDLLPGDCNFFKSGKIIGRGKLPSLMSHQTLRLPLAVDPLIIATKYLMKQETPDPKRILLHYKLQLVNRYKRPYKIGILDVLPISKQPRSEIRLSKANPSPFLSEGLLKWDINLEEEWIATYTIEILERKGWLGVLKKTHPKSDSK